MKTSYYQNRRIDPAIHAVIQTSLGHPRFPKVNYPVAHWEEIMPDPAMLALAFPEYRTAYRAKLDAIGLPTIREGLAELVAMNAPREPLLCCFESLKTPGQFCHRRIFAEWFEEQTGEEIPEL